MTIERLTGEAERQAVRDGFDMHGTVVLGDWVQTRHNGYRGRVYQIDHFCEESDTWLSIQWNPPTAAQLVQPWVHVLVHGGGAVVVPISSVTRLGEGEHPATLTNASSGVYFRDEVQS